MRRLVHGAAVLCALVACSEGAPRAPARPVKPAGTQRPAQPAASTRARSASETFLAPSSQAGRLVLAGGELSFVPCDSGERRIRLLDMPNGQGAALVKEFRGGDGDVPALVLLNETRLADIRYAAPEGRDCARLLPPNVLDARGNEPFWSVEVYGDSARLRLPLSPAGVVFTHGTWRRLAGSQWAYEARRGPTGSEEFLLLQLTESHCVDSMSGARYPYRAALIRDGDPAAGCAVEGRLAQGQ